MTESEQKKELFSLFNKEQGKFAYFTCALLITMIGYSFNLVYNSNEIYIILPLVSIFFMFISLGSGMYYILHRLSNYYNNFGLLDQIKKTDSSSLKDFCKSLIEKNSNKQDFWHKFHWYTILIGPLIMFIWLILIKFSC